MYASIEFKTYFVIISCLCNLLHTLQLNNRNRNRHPILSSVYDVIKLNQIDKKIMNSGENRGPSLMKQMMNDPNNRRYTSEDYEYEDPYDYSTAESKHK